MASANGRIPAPAPPASAGSVSPIRPESLRAWMDRAGHIPSASVCRASLSRMSNSLSVIGTSETLKNAKIEPDVSFSEFIRGFDFDEETRRTAIGFVEGFNAARADRISVESLRLAQQASDEISGDTPYRILGGYDHVVRWLSSF